MPTRQAWSLLVGSLGGLLAVGFAVTLAANGGQQLAGSEWRPIQIAGKALSAETPLFIRFEADNKVAAHGGCNRMGGKYTIDKVNLRIGPLMSTRKACQPDVMALEQAFGNALEETRLFLRESTRLTMKNAQGVTTMRLVQTDPD